MRTRTRVYLLADLLEQPALNLAIEDQGFDRRELERLLRGETRTDPRREQIGNARPGADFIGE